MKKAFILSVFVFFTCALFAQKSAKDVFQEDNIVWYGLDFTKAKFIGQFDQAMGAAPASANDIKYSYIPSWNSLILSEPNKYNLVKTFRKSNVINDLSIVENKNNQISEDNLMSFNNYSFDNSAAVVENIVSGYPKGHNNEGIGLVFIVEYFNRLSQETSVYVTFFDIASKNILFTEKVTGKPRGIGLRNYWAGSIFNILTEIEKKAYKRWEKTYGS